MNKKASVGIVVLIISILILAFAIYLLVSKISSNSEYSENSSYNSANNSQYYSKSTDLDIDESNNLLYVAESNNPKIDIYDLNQLKIIDTLDSGYSPADFSEARIYVDSSLSKAFVYSKTSTKKEFTIFDLKSKNKVCSGELGLITIPDESGDKIISVSGNNGNFQIKKFDYSCNSISSFSVSSNLITDSRDGKIGVLNKADKTIEIYDLATGNIIDTLAIGDISLKHNTVLNSDWFVGVLDEKTKLGIAIFNIQTKSLSKVYFEGTSLMNPVLYQNYYFLPSHTTNNNVVLKIDLNSREVIESYSLNDDEIAFIFDSANGNLYFLSKNKKIRKV